MSAQRKAEWFVAFTFLVMILGLSVLMLIFWE